jgi:hypothetical protein
MTKMNQSTLIERTLFGLYWAEETELYQFRKVLLITNEHNELEIEFKPIFPKAKIYTLQKDLDFLNISNHHRHCFDLIVIDNINFTQINQLLDRFKCRYIMVSGANTSLYIKTNKDFRRIEFAVDAAIYKNNRQFYDVFMPIGPLDYEIAQASIQNKIENLSGMREIFYCAKKDLSVDASYISESQYPFTEEDLYALRHENTERTGWYHAQLKQFYLHSVEQGTLNFYVALCTDLFFLKPYELFEKNGLPIYMYGAGPTHPPCIGHMRRLLPQLRCFDGRSAVSHHMLFERNVIERLLTEVEYVSGKDFWKIFYESIDDKQYEAAGTSDYDIYFNYLRLIRRNISTREPNYVDSGDPAILKNFNGDFYCNHAYARV